MNKEMPDTPQSVYIYINKRTGEEYRLEDLQNKYGLGFGDRRLWDIIESCYRCEERLRPRGEGEDIVFEEDEEDG